MGDDEGEKEGESKGEGGWERKRGQAERTKEAKDTEGQRRMYTEKDK